MCENNLATLPSQVEWCWPSMYKVCVYTTVVSFERGSFVLWYSLVYRTIIHLFWACFVTVEIALLPGVIVMSGCDVTNTVVVQERVRSVVGDRGADVVMRCVARVCGVGVVCVCVTNTVVVQERVRSVVGDRGADVVMRCVACVCVHYHTVYVCTVTKVNFI